MIKKLILTLLFSSVIYGQNDRFKKKYDAFIASNQQKYVEIDSFFAADRYDTIKLNYAFSKSKNLKSDPIEAYIANQLGTYFRNISNYKKSLYYHHCGLKLSKKIRNIEMETLSYNMLGVVYRRLDSVIPAIENHQNALSLIEKSKKPLSNSLIRSKAISLNSLGNIYLILNQNDLALSTFAKSLAIEKKIGNNLGIAINYQNIGGAYENQNNLALALENYKKSLEYNKTINSEIGLMICKNSIGIILLKQNETQEAIDYILPTIEIAKKSQDDFYISSSYINLGWAYNELGQIEKGKKYINIGLKIAIEQKFPSYIALSYKLLAEIAEKEQNYKLANQYLQRYYANKDKVSGEQNQKYLFDFITKYENEKRQTILKLKNNELKINQLKLANEKRQNWFYLVGLVLFGCLGSLFFYQSKNRKKTNRKLQILNSDLDEANKIKMRFFSILNHDLRSPVSTIIHFLYLQKDHPELLDEDSKNRLELKTMSSLENLLISMEDMLLWSKGQMDNFQPEPKEIRVSNLFNDIQSHFTNEEKVQLLFSNPQDIIFQVDENYLKTIIRNLTGNALKALESFVAQNDSIKPTITWTAWKNDENVFLSISDNGQGTSLDKFKALYDDKEVIGIKTGLGLHLIRDLAKAIQCEIVVTSEINQGTIFTLKF